MKVIPLTQGKSAFVSERDFVAVCRYKWCAHRSRKGVWYAVRTNYSGRGPSTISMHRQLLEFPKGQVDHRNGDGLDNRRRNLRRATHQQNRANQRHHTDNLSGYKGVTRTTAITPRWQARVRFRGQDINAGSYASPQAASDAYFALAKKLFGEFAKR